MAKFNGSCSGSAAAKYDLWLDVKQNSQDEAENKSNITIKLKLQRNDGYSASAYNLNASENSAVIKVNGSTKTSNTLAIDTRNSVTVVLAEWTGNVSHDDDGTLKLNLSGSFTMTGTSLAGGAVSAEFSCTDIPRASTLTIADSSVTPGGSFSFGISGVSSFKHKITCKIGSKVSRSSDEISAGTTKGTFDIPESWANYVTDDKKGTITVILSTYKGSKLIGRRRYSLTFRIPDTTKYKPEFDVELSEKGAPEGWNVYLQGISKLTVSIKNKKFKAGAEEKSISIKFDGNTKKKNNSSFEMLNDGDKKVVVRLTDTRGYYTEVEKTINVKEYYPPSIKIRSVARCDENGEAQKDGAYLLVSFKKKSCAVDELNASTTRYSIRKKGSTTATEENEVTESSPIVIGSGGIQSQVGYDVLMTIVDGVTGDEDVFKLGTAAIPFNIKKGGNGASFGCYAEKDDELLVAWDLRILGDLYYDSVALNVSDDLISEKLGMARYFPCLELVCLRFRLTAAKNLSANTKYTLGVFPNNISSLYSPLTVNIGKSGKNQATAGIDSGTGELIIYSDTEITKDTHIYISGIYFAYRDA